MLKNIVYINMNKLYMCSYSVTLDIMEYERMSAVYIYICKAEMFPSADNTFLLKVQSKNIRSYGRKVTGRLHTNSPKKLNNNSH